MGIITKLSFKQIKNHLQTEYGLCAVDIRPTKDGVSDSVYLLDTDKGTFVLKLFENASHKQVVAERELLSTLAALPVARVFGDISTLEDKPCALYEAARGSHEQRIKGSQISEIGGFLASMHALTRSTSSQNPSFASMCTAKKIETVGTPFESYGYFFDEMAALPVDGVIHGDLFPDNLFFEGGKLSCVIDFIEAFNGSFAFELGVVAFAFGITDKVGTLAASYGGYDEEVILRHARYAALFYGVGRYVGGRDYAQCFSFLQTHC